MVKENNVVQEQSGGRRKRGSNRQDKDIALKTWLKDDERFADFFNGVLFHGEQIIRPEDLIEKDSESDIVYSDKEGNKYPIRKNRDIVRLWKNKVNLAILAIENQTNVCNAMPVRVMLYDALTYDEELKIIHRMKKKTNRRKDYYSSFKKRDRIYPVVSIVFYYGKKPWKMNMDLYDMFRVTNDDNVRKLLLEYVPNYKINIVDTNNIEQVKNFKTDLQIVFGMLKCRENEDEMKKYIEDNQKILSNVPKETIDAISSLVNIKEIKRFMPVIGEGGNGNMCKAFADMKRTAMNEGRAEGRAEEKTIVVKNLITRQFAMEDICAIAECDEEFVYKVKELLA